jgi:multiple sugar transport system permease protein
LAIITNDKHVPLPMGTWARLKYNRSWLGFWFMFPALAFLLVFLTYPLGLGIWLSFTDTRIGYEGVFIGLENFEWLFDDPVFWGVGEFLESWTWSTLWESWSWGAVEFTFVYTIVASIIKFALGFYLAILLNNHMPFKALIRAIVLLPFIVPTVLSAIAFWWIYDTQFSIISWSLEGMGLLEDYIDFLGDRNWARASVIATNIWRGIPFVAITRSSAGPWRVWACWTSTSIFSAIVTGRVRP